MLVKLGHRSEFVAGSKRKNFSGVLGWGWVIADDIQYVTVMLAGSGIG